MRKSFCACRRKAVDIPDHCLHDCSPSLPTEVGFGMPQAGSIKSLPEKYNACPCRICQEQALLFPPCSGFSGALQL